VQLAQAQPSFEWIAGTAVKGLLWRDAGEASRNGNRVAGVQLADGRTIAADLVLGADGRTSVLRQRANLTLDTEPESIDVLWFKLPAPADYADDNRFCTVVKGDRVFSLFHGAEAGKLHLAWAIAPSELTEQKDWATTFATLVPPEFVEHFRSVGDSISAPMRLSVLVGRCPQWHRPGLLLLGDAAHPMSPVRAQGINMALRDAIVAANHLVPVLKAGNVVDAEEVDGAIARIQAEREPEIIEAQQLQAHEASRGELLRHFGILRQGLSTLSPVAGPVIQQVWTQQQRPLRQGITQVRLKV
jgi:2-polyprenyl-6-methoxyphenol hydroxylase-like FAD-dependent oxidoreductase